MIDRTLLMFGTALALVASPLAAQSEGTAGTTQAATDADAEKINMVIV